MMYKIGDFPPVNFAYPWAVKDGKYTSEPSLLVFSNITERVQYLWLSPHGKAEIKYRHEETVTSLHPLQYPGIDIELYSLTGEILLTLENYEGKIGQYKPDGDLWIIC